MVERDEQSKIPKITYNKFLVYDILGILLVLLSMYFFYRTLDFLTNQNFLAAIVAAVIGLVIFSAGVAIIKVSAAGKIYEES
jgi:uncharacterized membrane protein YczE